MTRSLRALLASLAAAALLSACDDATTVDLLEIDATGQVRGAAFLDVNGNGSRDGSDTPLKGLPVVLTVAGGGQVVEEALTDSAGLFLMTDIPVGSYRLDLAPGSLGDSLEASGGGTDLKIERGDTTRVEFGATYPVLSLAEVRLAVPGRRVFTSGIALNPRVNFGDGLVHFQADSVYLRAVNVARATLNTGDSVRLLGRVRIDQGQPVLDDVTPYVLITTATIPVPRELTTAEAVTARGGTLDAALVRVRTASITDTATVNGAFRFRVDDGSGKIDVVSRPFLQLNNTAIRPDTILRINQLTGLLVPSLQENGETRWRIFPRSGNDVLLEVKQADLSVSVTSDRTSVVKGDTISFTVVVRNAGPLGASGVQLVDSLPRTLTLLTQKTSRGSYSPATGLWEMDSLRVGASDTLTLVARVTTDQVGNDANVARVKRVLYEVDPNPDNNLAGAAFTIAQKLSDLSIRVLADRSTAMKGDTINFTVIVSNAGPREASGVQVTDTIPFGLTLRQATTSRGSYDSELAIWDIGSLAVGAADTLRLKTEVTTALTGQGANRARVTRIVDGGDPNTSNNLAQVIFTLVAPPPPPSPEGG